MNKNNNGSITIILLLFSSFIFLFFAIFFNEFIVDLINPHHPLLQITREKIRVVQRNFFIIFAVFITLTFLVIKIKKIRDIGSKEMTSNVMLSILILFVPIFIFENLLYPFVRRKTTIFIENTQLGWKLRPDTFDWWGGVKVKINQKGLRGPLLPYKKPNSIKRILFLGDSVTFGYMLEDDEKIYPYLIQTYINSDKGKEIVQCINAGVDGYSSWQESIYLEREGINYNPDLVVIGFVLNDVTERFLLKRFGGEGIGSQLQETIEKKGWWLKRNSNIYIAVSNIIARLRFGKDIKKGAIEKEVLDVHALIDHPNRKDVMNAWEITLKNLEKIISFCKEKNIEILLVVFPYNFQFDDISRFSLPQTKLQEFAERHQIHFIDMLNYLYDKTQLQNEKVNDYLLDEDHLSYKGHIVTAEVIVDYILRKNLLKNF